jgi:hypothetical protein
MSHGSGSIPVEEAVILKKEDDSQEAWGGHVEPWQCQYSPSGGS